MSSILRQAARVARPALSQRAFSVSTVARKDLVQDLYIREIKAYKPAPQAQDAHVGAVKTFSAPASPAVPKLPTDLASELAAYDAVEPTTAAAPATAQASLSEEHAGGAEEFLVFLEQDLPKPVDHHH